MSEARRSAEVVHVRGGARIADADRAATEEPLETRIPILAAVLARRASPSSSRRRSA